MAWNLTAFNLTWKRSVCTRTTILLVPKHINQLFTWLKQAYRSASLIVIENRLWLCVAHDNLARLVVDKVDASRASHIIAWRGQKESKRNNLASGTSGHIDIWITSGPMLQTQQHYRIPAANSFDKRQQNTQQQNIRPNMKPEETGSWAIVHWIVYSRKNTCVTYIEPTFGRWQGANKLARRPIPYPACAITGGTGD